ncbi:HSF-type DNA-binding-domain-containing protein [Mycena galericulata]|nr:HSF-type DNA-binding-domain-containing protein [Mycena galericulata]
MDEQYEAVPSVGPGEDSPTEQHWSLNTRNPDTIHDGAFPEHSMDDGGSRGTNRMLSATDFIKKLYKILSDGSDENIIAWGPQRDRFVVKDADEFRRSVLPRMFKHSNYASFVRQLNKYGFRKIKHIDDPENTWTFQHPDFHADHRYALDNIRRKVPVQRKSPSSESGTSPNAQVEFLQAEVTSLQTQLVSLGTGLREAVSHIQVLEHSHQTSLDDLVALQHVMAQQEKLVARLIQRDHGLNVTASGDSQGSPSFESRSPAFLARQTQGQTQTSTGDSRRDTGSSSTTSIPDWKAYRELAVRMGMPSGSTASSEEGWSPEGLTAWPSESDRTTNASAVLEQSVFTRRARSSSGSGSGIHNTRSGPQRGTPAVSMRRSMFMPRWAIAPHVLLVEDDATSRKLGSKFLQLFGCTIDSAADGADAVNKMSRGRYDLVFIDLGMPQLGLGGVSATSVIRTFNQQTPIISMPSSAGPTPLAADSSSGTSGTWPKPFNQGVLLDILKKHLTHLVAIKPKMSSSMRFNPLATPPPLSPNLNNGGFSAFQAGGLTLDYGSGEGSVNPFASLDREDDLPDNFHLMMRDTEFNLRHPRDLDQDDPNGVDLRE